MDKAASRIRLQHFYVKSQNGEGFSGEDDNKCKKKCTFAARSVF